MTHSRDCRTAESLFQERIQGLLLSRLVTMKISEDIGIPPGSLVGMNRKRSHAQIVQSPWKRNPHKAFR